MRIIIFKDNTTLKISDQDEKNIFMISTTGKKGTYVKNTFLSFDSISRIVDEEDYCRQKHGRRPSPESQHPALPDVPVVPMTRDRHIRTLESCRRGMQNFLDRNPGENLNAKKLLGRMDQAIAKARADKNYLPAEAPTPSALLAEFL